MGNWTKVPCCGLDRPARSAMVGRNKSRSVLCGKCRCVACHIGASWSFDYGELILYVHARILHARQHFLFSRFLVLNEPKTNVNCRRLVNSAEIAFVGCRFHLLGSGIRVIIHQSLLAYSVMMIAVKLGRRQAPNQYTHRIIP